MGPETHSLPKNSSTQRSVPNSLPALARLRRSRRLPAGGICDHHAIEQILPHRSRKSSIHTCIYSEANGYTLIGACCLVPLSVQIHAPDELLAGAVHRVHYGGQVDHLIFTAPRLC